MSNPADKSNPNRIPQTIDIVPSRAAGLGAPSAPKTGSTNQAYQEIFREAFSHVNNNSFGSSTPSSGMAAPSDPHGGPNPYDETVIAVHHSKRGIRVVLQANPKVFIIIVFIVIALLSKPGLGDVLAAILKSIGH